MKKIFIVISVFLSSVIHSETIASCGPVEGITYYPYYGPFSSESNSGFQKDAISKGKTSLTLKDKEFDVLYIDTLGDITSSRDSGANVLINSFTSAQNKFSVLTIYPNNSLEVYSFWKDKGGSLKYSMTLVRGGTSSNHKTSILEGDCNYIKFEWMETYFDD